MTDDETRLVLIKPGDVLLIGGVGTISAQAAAEFIARLKDVIGVRAVLFPDEIELGRLGREQLLTLVTAHAVG